MKRKTKYYKDKVTKEQKQGNAKTKQKNKRQDNARQNKIKTK